MIVQPKALFYNPERIANVALRSALNPKNSIVTAETYQLAMQAAEMLYQAETAKISGPDLHTVISQQLTNNIYHMIKQAAVGITRDEVFGIILACHNGTTDLAADLFDEAYEAAYDKVISERGV